LSVHPTAAEGVGYTSFVIAMIIPSTTNTTIATCIQIQVEGMTPDSVLAAASV
jgi:hypothetical protein